MLQSYVFPLVKLDLDWILGSFDRHHHLLDPQQEPSGLYPRTEVVTVAGKHRTSGKVVF